MSNPQIWRSLVLTAALVVLQMPTLSLSQIGPDFNRVRQDAERALGRYSGWNGLEGSSFEVRSNFVDRCDLGHGLTHIRVLALEWRGAVANGLATPVSLIYLHLSDGFRLLACDAGKEAATICSSVELSLDGKPAAWLRATAGCHAIVMAGEQERAQDGSVTVRIHEEGQSRAGKTAILRFSRASRSGSPRVAWSTPFPVRVIIVNDLQVVRLGVFAGSGEEEIVIPPARM